MMKLIHIGDDGQVTEIINTVKETFEWALILTKAYGGSVTFHTHLSTNIEEPMLCNK